MTLAFSVLALVWVAAYCYSVTFDCGWISPTLRPVAAIAILQPVLVFSLRTHSSLVWYRSSRGTDRCRGWEGAALSEKSKRSHVEMWSGWGTRQIVRVKKSNQKVGISHVAWKTMMDLIICNVMIIYWSSTFGGSFWGVQQITCHHLTLPPVLFSHTNKLPPSQHLRRRPSRDYLPQCVSEPSLSDIRHLHNIQHVLSLSCAGPVHPYNSR